MADYVYHQIFPLSVVSQFMTSPSNSHWDVVVRILRCKGLLFEDQGHVDWQDHPLIDVLHPDIVF